MATKVIHTIVPCGQRLITYHYTFIVFLFKQKRMLVRISRLMPDGLTELVPAWAMGRLEPITPA